MDKTCKKCLISKPITEFYKNPKVVGGRIHQCKSCVKDRMKIYIQNNVEKLYLDRKRRYWADRENALRKSIEWGRQNKDKRRIIKKRWSDKNQMAKAVMNKNWNANKLGAIGRFTLEEYKAKLESHGNKCGYCKEREPYTVDHIIPISRGGSNYIDNIMPCCLQCNGQKRNYLLSEWKLLENCYHRE